MSWTWCNPNATSSARTIGTGSVKAGARFNYRLLSIMDTCSASRYERKTWTRPSGVWRTVDRAWECAGSIPVAGLLFSFNAFYALILPQIPDPLVSLYSCFYQIDFFSFKQICTACTRYSICTIHAYTHVLHIHVH